MKKRIILVGKAASGKDFFKDYLVRTGKKPSISHTTRPMRCGEINGETYHFVTEDKFLEMVDNDEFFEYKDFNGWSYGTSREEVFESEVFIFTPSGVRSLNDKFIKDSVVVYFDIDAETRLKRLKERSDSETIKRRMNSDFNDFIDFKRFDLRITSPEYSCAIVKTIIDTMALIDVPDEERKSIHYYAKM
jgi:guanylate kinase